MKPPEEEELFMKEIIELKELLQKKRDKLSGSEAYAQGEINNVHLRIGDFERRFKQRERNPAHRTETLGNFKKEANQIRKDIEAIKIKADLLSPTNTNENH